MPNNKEKFISTWSFLTLFPWPRNSKTSPPQLAMMPLVGLTLGFILYLTSLIFSGLTPQVTTVIVLLLWLISTGFLHLDGLADLVDGLAASHRDKNKLLDVMKEPHIGSFAVVALILLILCKFVLLGSLAQADVWAGLLLIPAWARLGAAWWAESLPALNDGLANWCKKAGSANLMPWFILLFVLSLIFQPMLMLAPLILWAWKAFLERQLQGMNGDCLGAGIEVCELGLLLLCCLSL
ncbi:MAG: adenosylcobinamide-GDP ribazoletransferase [Ghiorsea sp.]